MGVFHKRFGRLPAMLALAGVVLYTALVPGHVVSQASTFVGDESVSGPAQAAHDCHGDVAHTDGATDPAKPSAPKKKCPFCTGYAAFLTALVNSADAGILDAEYATPSAGHIETAINLVALKRPRNRGPPNEL
jgi:hypothetical protein